MQTKSVVCFEPSILFRALRVVVACFTLALTLCAEAQVETVLHTFDGADGYNPVAGLVMDAMGNLYGTTFDGGVGNAGTVFELTPSVNGWRESVIHNFSGGDGAGPMAGLIFDAAGN